MATVLIVDDNAVNRDYLEMVVASGGYRVLGCSSGAEALALVRAEQPELVLADLQMPVMDGHEFIRRLRAEPDIRQPRVILCSVAYADGELPAWAAGVGVSRLLPMPSEPAQILQSIKAALGPAAPRLAPPLPAAAAPASAVRVLVVEDDAGDARLMRAVLTSAGSAFFAVAVASRLSEALAKLDAEPFDLVVLDLSLPDSHGIDSFLQVRRRAPHTAVLVLTGLDDTELAVQIVQAGAQDYLVKGQVESSPLVRAVMYAIERQRLQNELREESLLDGLTGLYNRRGFTVLAEQQLRMSRRKAQGVLLAYGDLDDLKVINDRHGHAAGDRALRHSAALLRETFRASDILARVGGDEFVVLAVEAAPDAGELLLAHLRQNLERLNAQLAAADRFSVSFGAKYRAQLSHVTLETMLHDADQAQYAAKRLKKEGRARSDST